MELAIPWVVHRVNEFRSFRARQLELPRREHLRTVQNGVVWRVHGILQARITDSAGLRYAVKF